MRPTLAGELGLSNHQRTLRVDQPEAVAAALLASLQPLGTDEALVVQWVLSPIGPVARINRAPRGRKNGAELLFESVATSLHDSEAVRAARAKQDTALFLASARLGVLAEPKQARLLLRRLSAPFHVANTPGAHLYRRSWPSRWTARQIERRSAALVVWPCTLNARELSALVGFPVGSPQMAGLRLGGSRKFPPPAEVPSVGRVVATATFSGAERPLALSVRDSLAHLWLCGPTGTGKSTVLASLILQDLEAGRPVVLIDPKGDLASDVLDRMPKERIDDVILLDPSDDQRPVGLNPLAGAEHNPELVSDQVLGIFHRLYKAYWGPRTQDVLHSALLTLVAQEPGSTLVDVPLLLTNDAFRRQMVGKVSDHVLLQFWAAYEAMSTGERAQAIGPVQNKLRQFLLRPRLRAVIGQAVPTFTLEQVLAEHKVLLVSLPAGLLGDEAAALIGSLVVARLWQAIQGRAALRPEQRNPAFVYLDEFQTFVHLPTDLAAVLATSRGLGVGFVLAHQHFGQIPNELRSAVVANARSRIFFQTAAGDAAAMAREIGTPVEGSDLAALPAYEVMASLSAGGQITAPASGRTSPLPPSLGTGAAARAASRARYGRDRAEVDAAVQARQQGPQPTGPTMRRKRGGI